MTPALALGAGVATGRKLLDAAVTGGEGVGFNIPNRKLLDAAVVGGEGVGFNIPNRRLHQADLGAEGSTAASSTSNGGLPMVSPSSQTAMAPSTNMNSGRKLLDASVSDSSTVPGAGFVSGRKPLDVAVSDPSSGAGAGVVNGCKLLDAAVYDTTTARVQALRPAASCAMLRWRTPPPLALVRGL